MTDAPKQATDTGKKVSRVRHTIITAAAAVASFALIAVASNALDTGIGAPDQLALFGPGASAGPVIDADADS